MTRKPFRSLFGASGTRGVLNSLCPILASRPLAACKETAQVRSPTTPRRRSGRTQRVATLCRSPSGYYEWDGGLVCAGRVSAGMSQKTLRTAEPSSGYRTSR